MSETPLFKRAFVRGLNEELVRHGAAMYPSKEAADHAADFVADDTGMPDPITAGDHLTAKVAMVLCDRLILASQHLCKEAGDRYNPQVTKTAQVADPAETASDAAWDLMEKAAAETGSLYEGGDVPNDMPAAAAMNAEAALEASQRPENYANKGEDAVGTSSLPATGVVGDEKAHPDAPTKAASMMDMARRFAPAVGGGAALGGAGGALMADEGDRLQGALMGAGIGAGAGAAGRVGLDKLRGMHLERGMANSGATGGVTPDADDLASALEAVEGTGMGGGAAASKMGSVASLTQIVRKIAGDTGSLVDGTPTPNDLNAAATHNAEAALEAKDRPENYANKGEAGVGQTDFKVPASAQVGTETARSDQGTKAAAFQVVFKTAAEELIPYLPTMWDDQTKVAHVRNMMGLDTQARAQYLHNVYTSLGANVKVAADLTNHYVQTR